MYVHVGKGASQPAAGGNVQEYYVIMIKRVVQLAAGGKSLKIHCVIRKMRRFGLNCLFYFCIDYPVNCQLKSISLIQKHLAIYQNTVPRSTHSCYTVGIVYTQYTRQTNTVLRCAYNHVLVVQCFLINYNVIITFYTLLRSLILQLIILIAYQIISNIS